MKVAIIDSNYNNQKYSGLAATWLRWAFLKNNINEASSSNADFLFITISSQQGISALKREIKRINNKKAKIILGGGGCYAPAIFEDIANLICVGEGENFVNTFFRNGYDAAKELPEAWVPGESRKIIPSKIFPWDIPPLKHPDGTARVFGSRSCKYFCLFCQTGWESPYRTNPDIIHLQSQINDMEIRNKRIAVITNDGGEGGIKIHGQQEFLSIRVDNIKKIMPLTRKIVKSVRLGIEGVSERLRIAVAKPVLNIDLLNISFQLLSAGIGVRWFFIAGLPGENENDYEELKWLVKELSKLPKGVVMMNFHAYIPQPATPLCILPVIDGYWERFNEFRRWFFHGPGFTRHVQIIAPAQHKGRMERAMESMAANENEIRRGWFDYDNKNWRIQYNANPEKLRKIATRYAQKCKIKI